jgi:hypothetical protein
LVPGFSLSDLQRLVHIQQGRSAEDGWKFFRAEVAGFEADRRTMRLEYSRGYGEKFEAATILRILKVIVARFLDND